MQDIIQDDPELENYQSTSSLFKVNTESLDYFEITKQTYLAERALNIENQSQETGQIETISVKAGGVKDFYADVKATTQFIGKTEAFGFIPSYRIMKADKGYLAARISYRVPGNIGLASLSNPLEKDVSQDSNYRY